MSTLHGDIASQYGVKEIENSNLQASDFLVRGNCRLNGIHNASLSSPSYVHLFFHQGGIEAQIHQQVINVPLLATDTTSVQNSHHMIISQTPLELTYTVFRKKCFPYSFDSFWTNFMKPFTECPQVNRPTDGGQILMQLVQIFFVH